VSVCLSAGGLQRIIRNHKAAAAGKTNAAHATTHRATQLAPSARYTASEWRTNLTLAPTSEYSASFK